MKTRDIIVGFLVLVVLITGVLLIKNSKKKGEIFKSLEYLIFDTWILKFKSREEFNIYNKRCIQFKVKIYFYSMAWNLYENNKLLPPLKFSNGKTQEDIVKEVLNSIKDGEKIIIDIKSKRLLSINNTIVLKVDIIYFSPILY